MKKYKDQVTIVYNQQNPTTLVANVVSNITLNLTMPGVISGFYLLGFHSVNWFFDTGGDYFNKYRAEIWQRYSMYTNPLGNIGDLQGVTAANYVNQVVEFEGSESYDLINSPIYFPGNGFTVYASALIQNYVIAGAGRLYLRFVLNLGLVDKQEKAFQYAIDIDEAE